MSGVFNFGDNNTSRSNGYGYGHGHGHGTGIVNASISTQPSLVQALHRVSAPTKSCIAKA